MTHAMNRRQVIAGTVLAAAAALPVTAAVAVGIEDPIIALVDRHVTLWEECPDDPAGRAAWNRNVDALTEEMGRTAPTSKRGAIAGLRHVEWVCERWGTTDHEQLILRNCIDFLEREA